jgi:hypothetical protein
MTDCLRTSVFGSGIAGKLGYVLFLTAGSSEQMLRSSSDTSIRVTCGLWAFFGCAVSGKKMKVIHPGQRIILL